MRKYILILVAMLPFMTECRKDDRDAMVSSNVLYQTMWDCDLRSYGPDNTPKGTQKFVLEFISRSEGKLILSDLYLMQDFQYSITDSIISFKGADAILGDWYITDYSNGQIALLSYIPYKTTITLKKLKTKQ